MKKIILRGVFFVLAIACVGVLLAMGNFAQKQAIHKAFDAAENLMRNRYSTVLERFQYDYDIKEDVFSSDDNFVRQMGAVYIFGEALRFDEKNETKILLKTIAESILQKTKVHEKNGIRYRYIANEPKLGALALFYAGVLALEEYDKKWMHEHETAMSEIMNTILWHQKKNGDFAGYINFDFDYSIKENTKGLGYFTGETLVALAKYHVLHPGDMSARAAVLHLYEYLDRKHSKERYKGLYLWYMTATEVLVNDARSGFLSKEKEMFKKAAIAHHGIEKSAVTFAKKGRNTCANAEGLGYYLRFAGDASEIANDRRLFQEALQYNLDLQIRTPYWMFADTSGKVEKVKVIDKKASLGAFLARNTRGDTRIDFTQHCMGMLLGYLK